MMITFLLPRHFVAPVKTYLHAYLIKKECVENVQNKLKNNITC